MGDEGLSGVSVLIRLWEQSGRRLRERCRGLTDEEFFWEPVADCWNIRPDEQHVGGWSYEYEFAPADPAPLTTLLVGQGVLTLDELCEGETAKRCARLGFV